jgi:hypothetical protein
MNKTFSLLFQFIQVRFIIRPFLESALKCYNFFVANLYKRFFSPLYSIFQNRGIGVKFKYILFQKFLNFNYNSKNTRKNKQFSAEDIRVAIENL